MTFLRIVADSLLDGDHLWYSRIASFGLWVSFLGMLDDHYLDGW